MCGDLYWERDEISAIIGAIEDKHGENFFMPWSKEPRPIRNAIQNAIRKARSKPEKYGVTTSASPESNRPPPRPESELEASFKAMTKSAEALSCKIKREGAKEAFTRKAEELGHSSGSMTSLRNSLLGHNTLGDERAPAPAPAPAPPPPHDTESDTEPDPDPTATALIAVDPVQDGRALAAIDKTVSKRRGALL